MYPMGASGVVSPLAAFHPVIPGHSAAPLTLTILGSRPSTEQQCMPLLSIQKFDSTSWRCRRTSNLATQLNSESSCSSAPENNLAIMSQAQPLCTSAFSMEPSEATNLLLRTRLLQRDHEIELQSTARTASESQNSGQTFLLRGSGYLVSG